MKKIEVFDPAMCCSTGVCGPSVDPELTKVASSLGILEKKNIEVARYNLSTEPQKFVENPVVRKQLDESGEQALPLILVDGEVAKTGAYPNAEEFAAWTGLEKSIFSPQPKTQFNILD
ncbi:arsenite efflux transporter metallochaperone ArsD [Halobacillus sp. Marseille-Q1614]|uniref:arsenite efflux transporter metallochaperone ArsD n=1 Tax=Halobacillus sp. Marseille-Q1614 TaxID=2709134 RepID=UPI00156DDF08|nr:arsenite efflux transporter metallochaperone ArsD [Halobacillus sp. Marseille-Q1614]